MVQRQYPFLDPYYDKDHRGHLMADEGKVSDSHSYFHCTVHV
jgi:hypothetical protein